MSLTLRQIAASNVTDMHTCIGNCTFAFLPSLRAWKSPDDRFSQRAVIACHTNRRCTAGQADVDTHSCHSFQSDQLPQLSRTHKEASQSTRRRLMLEAASAAGILGEPLRN